MPNIELFTVLAATLVVAVEPHRLWSFPIEETTVHRHLQSRGQQGHPYSGFGVHFVPMYFGNPAQLRILAVSTGGDYTALPCEDCTDCGPRGSNVYNYTQSSGFSRTACDSCNSGNSCINHRCMVGKTSRDFSAFTGYEVSDLVYHGGGDNNDLITGTDAAQQFGFPLRFVCQTTTRGFFNSVMDGVLGLSPAPSSFLSQMYEAGKVEHPRFSLCFNGADVNSHETGVVTFGGYKQAFVNTEMVFAKKIEGKAYKVVIKKVHLRVGGGSSVRPETDDFITVNAEGPVGMDPTAVVDSSEPFLTFDKRFEEPFRAAWHEATGKEFSHARITLTSDQMRALPTLLIELEGDPGSPHELDPASVPSLTADYNVLVAVPAIHYMEHMLTDVRPHRARIHFEGNGGAVFGASLMKGHTVVYEPDLNRIGFAESRRCQTGGEGGGRNGAGVAVDGRTDENKQENEVTSIATSGGTTVTESKASDPSSISPAGIDDDLFVAGGDSQEFPKEEDYDGGGCFSASCRSFMAIGYVFVGTALAVVYRVSRPKERMGMEAYQQYMTDDAVLQNHHDLSPVYRRKAWNENGDGGFMA